MRDFSLTGGTRRLVTRMQLVKMKLRAIRAGMWFRVLPRIDRALIDLTIKVADNIRSKTLTKSIVSVVKKLEDLFESKFIRTMRDTGLSLTSKLSLIAQKWGNKTAETWNGDLQFARYLTVMKLNE